MTTAQQISEQFHNDGQCWENDDTHIDAACATAGGTRDWEYGYGTDSYRWTFRDGSCLTMHGDAWDYGYPECFCWQGAGHKDDCVATL